MQQKPNQLEPAQALRDHPEETPIAARLTLARAKNPYDKGFLPCLVTIIEVLYKFGA